MSDDPRSRRPITRKDWPKHWLLTRAEAKALLEKENWTPDPENDDLYWNAYVSDRGELLRLKTRGRSELYESRQALAETRAEIYEKGATEPRSHHCLEGLLPQGLHFIEAVPSLIDQLAGLLKVPRESLDGSFESVHVVDAALKKVRPKRRILETENFFAALVAYTGEVIRKEVNGHWWLQEVPGGIYEPYILLEKDRFDPLINPFLNPYKMIIEPAKGGLSLAVVVSAALMGLAKEKPVERHYVRIDPQTLRPKEPDE